MALKPGQVLGTHEIVAPLGVGGMGEVYRAVDRNLGREVAIKVLTESQLAPTSFKVQDGEVEFQSDKDPERLARLEVEARVLASLNHPNIATLFGFFKATPDGGGEIVFLAMELVEGETLEDWIERRPLSIAEAIDVFSQIAEGLEAAHEKGITHRDLKPANIMISAGEDTDVGRVKILDFGLARALGSGDEEDEESSPGEDVTLTYASSQRSKLRGTLGYLSPEQARGKGIDKRADIWAYGCCLFESLTARRTFKGQTVTDTLSEILKGEPRWDKLPETTPVAIERLLRRCLAKKRSERLRDIGDARLELADALLDAGAEPAVASASGWGLGKVSAAVAAALLVGVVTSRLIAPASVPELEESVSRLAVGLPDSVPISFDEQRPLALSADGETVIYVGVVDGTRQLYRRSMSRREVEAIAGTEGARNPFLSPDGLWIGFMDGTAIKRVPIGGGQAVTVTDGALPVVAAWGPDETIIFSVASQPLQRVSATGGEAQPLTELVVQTGLQAHQSPVFLPGAQAVLYSTFSPPDITTIQAVRLETGEQHQVLDSGTAPHYLDSGHMVFAREGDLWAVPFDPEALAVTAAPVRVLEGVLHTAEPHPQYDVSPDGTLVYVPGGLVRLDRRMVWVDFDGTEEALGAEQADWGFPRVSPDGTRVAVSSFDVDNSDVWVYDIEREAQVRFSFADGVDVGPVWTRDGRRIAFSSSPAVGIRPRLKWKAADGSGEVEDLSSTEGPLQLAGAFTPDDEQLLFTELSTETGWDVWVLDVESGDVRSLVASPKDDSAIDLSSDGRWLAYQSDESGRDEVYVRPFPDVNDGLWQISTQGGLEPSWSPDGRRLFYRAEGQMYAVEIDTREGLRAGRPEVLFDLGILSDSINLYDVSPVEERFLVVRESSALDVEAGRPELRLVQNWSRVLEELAPTS